jgi:hypothetical protein
MVDTTKVTTTQRFRMETLRPGPLHVPNGTQSGAGPSASRTRWAGPISVLPQNVPPRFRSIKVHLPIKVKIGQ